MLPVYARPGGHPVLTGLTILPEVAWGSHLCHFYRNPDELLEVLVAFYRAGLEAHDKCLWITAPPCTATMARAGLGAVVADLDGFEQSGQLEIIDYRDWYLRGGELSADQIVGGWLDREDKALAAGFDGLRLSGNPNWLDGKSWDAFAEYEGRVHIRRFTDGASWPCAATSSDNAAATGL